VVLAGEEFCSINEASSVASEEVSLKKENG
jgi:hypothetical protein